MYPVASYILPTGTKLNPANPEGAEYFNEGQVAYVMRRVDEDRSRPTRVFTSFGELGEEWAIGKRWTCRHDQTNARLGDYEVVGIVNFMTGKWSGDVPDRKLSHCVFK